MTTLGLLILTKTTYTWAMSYPSVQVANFVFNSAPILLFFEALP